ncbi:poly-beta-1,6-N-acetyl-D-glucosamine N-deacetylase PgaB [Basfia succiniciproducens]|uniref:poly-beta-1,6-N-acetyl-D-glucosamine N-deacetylase PgaB n=1 Tax=Basfia succiniciproducens TaxID=653940 RepID=UPI0008D15A5D|nr:poly-beta-1,6-N-acetyl-D-glucosamine N-deacetylase PgaB [Basfia succiniciproducens]SEP75715.1 biofilm PGA synthesis lipoprotein PgaB [Basfia succiniciproducens]
MFKHCMRLVTYLSTSLLFAVQALAANNHFGVLCYHNIIDESVQSEKYYPQTISAQKLISQFNWLRTNGYIPVSMQQILDARNGGKALPEKSVLLTFDDGYQSFYTVIYPLLKAYNYPAVYAIVTDWIETPANKKVTYGDEKLDRKEFVTWQQLREMKDSGLVEIASHTHDLHHGVKANPAGSSVPAVITPAYINGKYETESQYEARLRKDFQRSFSLLKQHLGAAPAAMIWPYGRFNEKAAAIAEEAGFKVHMSLVDTINNTPDQFHLGRLLLDNETSINTIENYLKNKNKDVLVQRSLRIKLDDVYDPNPAQQSKNLDALIERIYRQGIERVYIQAFSDTDNDGVADALYFYNQQLPVRADLFSRVVWIIKTRLGKAVYAWMPISAFKGKNNTQQIKSIYRDLALYSKINGILFDDNLSSGNKFTDLKPLDAASLRLTDELKEIVYPYALGGREDFTTMRMISAPVNMSDESEKQFNQNLAELNQHYDAVIVSAAPYVKGSELTQSGARNWLGNLIKKTIPQVAKDRLAFELQTVDWRTQQAITDDELIDWMRDIQTKYHFYNFGYYPDNFQENQPKLNEIRPHFSINTNLGLK